MNIYSKNICTLWEGKASYMYLEAIVALRLVLRYIAASWQVDLTIQVRGLR